MIRVLIIDDEKAICTICKSYLSDRKDILILGECGSVKEAETLINVTQPDLILLDIHLKGGTGFDVLKFFPNPTFKVIFVTISGEYALNAIKAGALDYILKPIDENELLKAIDKVKNQKQNTSQTQVQLATDFMQGKPERLIVRTAEAMHIVQFNDLMYCESDKGYTTFYLADGTEILVARPIKDYEQFLPPTLFVRTHQSFVVNIRFILQIKKDSVLVLKNKTEIPIAFRRKEELIKQLQGIR